MRVMVIVKASKESEAGVMPNTKLLTEMGKYNEQLAKAGIMPASDSLLAFTITMTRIGCSFEISTLHALVEPASRKSTSPAI
jgi:hypothetical protein